MALEPRNTRRGDRANGHVDLSAYLSQREAARLKGVSHEALRLAIKRGELRGVAMSTRLVLIHKNDLATYTPQKHRQRAGRASARARANERTRRR